MKILIAPDSFKDALSAPEVCKAIARGLRLVNPNVQTIEFPLADGGEGTIEILKHHLKLSTIHLKVHDPLMRKVTAAYCLSEDGNTAYIEMAAASGLERLSLPERDPLFTTSYGTGELIGDAMHRGVQHIVLGIGGSATNDAGMGMAAALGYRFLDADGAELLGNGINLTRINQIERKHVSDAISATTFKIICDVDNLFYGPSGAAHIYAAQKGASRQAVDVLDKGLRHFAAVARQVFKKDLANMAGAGAAGGLGAGVICFLNAQLFPGIQLMMELTKFDEALHQSDMVITGEGRIDAQSLQGKLISGICKKAQSFGIPVIALCGDLQATPEQIAQIGLQAAYSINSELLSTEESIRRTEENLILCAAKILRQHS